ncbi:LysR family transcriptional regulator [Candidatus Solirubrobacter pratensis]|uniref:LysR family transcriptional regulator n=1 Tax=Candidatus Solirubrobacter pratensis TaxID=1298857 RepID=UPI00041BA437|nr:LysR family transcriptional regulator [Candidatus Solirubrobacter pratensis]
MELRHLATFTAVAEEGSFTRAAGRLHVVQSAVSAGVRALERELGATLFDRTTHRVQLSEAGRALLPEARRTLAAAAAARDAVDQLRGGLRGTVRLGMMLSQRAVSVPRLVSALRAEHPGIEVAFSFGGSTVHAEEIRRGRLDLAFVGLPAGAAPGIALAPLSSEEMRLVVSAEHPLAGRDAVALEELAAERFADGPPEWGTRIANDRAFALAGVRRDVIYEVADLAGVAEFVRYGLAVAILPPTGIDARDGVKLVPIRAPAPEFTISLAAPADRELGAPARALMEIALR